MSNNSNARSSRRSNGSGANTEEDKSTEASILDLYYSLFLL